MGSSTLDVIPASGPMPATPSFSRDRKHEGEKVVLGYSFGIGVSTFPSTIPLGIL